MNLTPEQILALQSGSPVHLMEPQSNTPCVLLPAQVYDRVKALFEEVPLSSDEQLALLAESGKLAGWNDSSMDVYDNYDAHRP